MRGGFYTARKRRIGVAFLLVLSTTSVAGAQPGPPIFVEGEAPVEPPPPPPPEAPKLSLRERFGNERGEALIQGGEWQDRARGIERLAAAGTDEAIDAIVDAMGTGSAMRSNARTLLTAVRALAPHARREPVRKVLQSVLETERPGDPEAQLELETLARATAALALARAGTGDTLTALLAAVLRRGRAAEMARAALLGVPPKRLGPLAKSTKNTSAEVLDLLGELGDPRVIGILRKQLRSGDRDQKRAAAVALARLGDGTPVAQARRWAAAKDDPGLRVAGAEILVLLDASGAAAAVAQLVGDAATRSAGLRLAEDALSPALVPTLKAVVQAKVTPGEKLRAATILARMGGDEAAAVLLELLALPDLATTAAFGLAGSPGTVAREGLGRALAAAPDGAPRRLVLRAATVRALELDERVAGLEAALEQALASADPADRAAGAFGAAALGLRPITELLGSKQPEVRHAAARAALWLGPDAVRALEQRLLPEGAVPPVDAIAAGAALLLAGEDALATAKLAEWAERGGALGPLAALGLAARDSEPYRSRLMALLEGTDPLVRAHVALGLGASPQRDAVALLAEAYRYEADASVRRAIVRSLGVRTERRRITVLRLARDLDPDPGVRALARSALAGRRVGIDVARRGRRVAWVTLRPNDAAERGRAGGRPAVLVRDDGIAVPVVTDPDGVLLVPGLGDAGWVSLRLAPAPEPDEAPVDEQERR
jgi:HEAT repeat protein